MTIATAQLARLSERCWGFIPRLACPHSTAGAISDPSEFARLDYPGRAVYTLLPTQPRPGDAGLADACVGATMEDGLDDRARLWIWRPGVPITREQFFTLMASFASSVTVITSKGPDGVLRGLTATAFSSVSLDPRLCMVGVDNRSESVAAITESGKFVVNILSSDQEEISRRFASKLPDKYEGIAYQLGPETGAPILDGVLAWIECQVYEIAAGGDHTIFIGEILDGTANDGTPLLYFRGQYRQLA